MTDQTEIEKYEDWLTEPKAPEWLTATEDEKMLMAWKARAALDSGAVSLDVDHIAKALAGGKEGWDAGNDRCKEIWRGAARGVIAALRAPHQPSSERDLALRFGEWVRKRERDEWTVFVSMEHELNAFLAAQQEKPSDV